MSDYSQKLLEHFRDPRNVGVIKNPDGYARVENQVNGYTTDMYLRVENGQIQDIKFKTFGCTVTIASASALTDIVKGKTLDEIVNSGDSLKKLLELLQNELGDVPEKNWHCPPTSIQTLLFAICEYYRKNKDGKTVTKIEKTLAEVKCYFEKKLDQLEE
jgi:nitrogen fixation NifU-like protein